MNEELSVVDVAESRRYELRLDGDTVGLADYSLDGDVVTIPHVETAPQHRGNGYAARLMDGVVDHVRSNGRQLRPLCPFAADYLDHRPDTHDLIAS